MSACGNDSLIICTCTGTIFSFIFHFISFFIPLCFYRSTNNPNVANAKRVADLYAEVIGVLSQVRFLSVRMRFFAELRNPQNSVSVIISVIEGLSFVRVKMYPVEELEGWFAFLQVMYPFILSSLFI